MHLNNMLITLMLLNQATDNLTIHMPISHMEEFNPRSLMAHNIHKLNTLTNTTRKLTSKQINNNLTQLLEEITPSSILSLQHNLNLNTPSTDHNLISLTRTVHMLRNPCKLTISLTINLKHLKD